MFTLVTELSNGASLRIFDEGDKHYRIAFAASYWKEGAIDSLILSCEQQRHASINAGPHIHLYVESCGNNAWYLWIIGESYAHIILTEEIKTALREVDQILAKHSKGVPAHVAGKPAPSPCKSEKASLAPDPAAISHVKPQTNKDFYSLPKSTGSGGYIYFVRTKGTKASPFLCKIGKTGDLRQRLPSLQTGSQDILEYAECVYVGRNVATVEHEIHLELKSLRAHGEWFLITEGQINEICMWIATRKMSLEAPVVAACRADDHPPFISPTEHTNTPKPDALTKMSVASFNNDGATLTAAIEQFLMSECELAPKSRLHTSDLHEALERYTREGHWPRKFAFPKARTLTMVVKDLRPNNKLTRVNKGYAFKGVRLRRAVNLRSGT